MKTFSLQIISLIGKIFTGEVQSLALKTANGNIQIFADHMPIVVPSLLGEIIVVLPDHKRAIYAVSDGILDTAGNVSLLVDDAIILDKIDVASTEIILNNLREKIHNINKEDSRVLNNEYARLQSELLNHSNRLDIVKKWH